MSRPAFCLSISAVTCRLVPTPSVPKFSLPGWLRTSLTSSAALAAGKSGRPTSTKAEAATGTTGSNSLSPSYLKRPGETSGATVTGLATPNSMV